MNTEPNEFVALRRLLALKRHEQPPPGYFDRLANSIRSKLVEEQARQPWWSRIFALWDIRPAWAGAFAAAVAGLYVLGMSFSSGPDSTAGAPSGLALGSFSGQPSGLGVVGLDGLGGAWSEQEWVPTEWPTKLGSNTVPKVGLVVPVGFSVTRP